MDFIFEWNENKAKENLRKHNVSFEEGTTIFRDPFIATMPDPDHSDIEQRFISIGISINHRLLVVVHTERANRTRLISCRKATRVERRIYEENEN